MQWSSSTDIKDIQHEECWRHIYLLANLVAIWGVPCLTKDIHIHLLGVEGDAGGGTYTLCNTFGWSFIVQVRR